MSTTASFLTEVWKCLSADEWIKKMHASNPSYLGGRDQEDHGSKPMPGT
jgi:hypothetical protein